MSMVSHFGEIGEVFLERQKKDTASGGEIGVSSLEF